MQRRRRTRNRALYGTRPKVFLKEFKDALFVLISRQLKRLVMFGLWDQPEFLGSGGMAEKFSGHFRLDVGIAAAVDHEQGAWGQAGYGGLPANEAAATLRLHVPHAAAG